MSSESSSPRSSDSGTSTSGPAVRSNSAWQRQAVLFGILILGISMLLYERLHALPASKQAHIQLEELAGERLLSPDRPLTAEEVQALMGKAPSENRSDETNYLEKYSWMRGLPWQSYYIWVIYTKNKNYRMHVSNEAPERFMQADVEAEWDDEVLPVEIPMDVPTPAPQEPISDEPISEEPTLDDSLSPSSDEADLEEKVDE